MKDIILLFLVLTITIFLWNFKWMSKEAFRDHDLNSIRDSVAWRDAKTKGDQEFTRMLSTMPADMAMLTWISQHPELQVNIETEVFPEDSVTRSTFLDAEQLKMSYDDRLEALHKAKFSFLNDDHEHDVFAALKSDPVCRGTFAKVLMNDTIFGCLLNNLKIEGDLDYCFFDYFAKYPDDFRSLTDAFRRFKYGVQATSVASPVAALPSHPAAPSGPSTAPNGVLSAQTNAPSSMRHRTREQSESSTHPSSKLPSRVTQMCLTSYDPFPGNKRVIDELSTAKQTVEKLKKESAIKTLDIKKLQKDLTDNQEEMSTIRRACGYIYMPISTWLNQDSGRLFCESSMPHHAESDKPIMPYQSLSFSEVPRQQSQ